MSDERNSMDRPQLCDVTRLTLTTAAMMVWNIVTTTATDAASVPTMTVIATALPSAVQSKVYDTAVFLLLCVTM
jgi:hypothetical protein